jgi:hypothetical protein
MVDYVVARRLAVGIFFRRLIEFHWPVVDTRDGELYHLHGLASVMSTLEGL